MTQIGQARSDGQNGQGQVDAMHLGMLRMDRMDQWVEIHWDLRLSVGNFVEWDTHETINLLGFNGIQLPSGKLKAMENGHLSRNSEFSHEKW